MAPGLMNGDRGNLRDSEEGLGWEGKQLADLLRQSFPLPSSRPVVTDTFYGKSGTLQA
jgi:hypothetical protein